MVEGQKVIAITGEIRAGKDTANDFFEQLILTDDPDLKVGKFRFSTINSEILSVLRLPKTRENYSGVGKGLINGLGKEVFARAVRERLKTDFADCNFVLLNGMRFYEDALMVQALPLSQIIFVTASPNICYQRALESGEKVGEQEITFKQFMAQEAAVTERDLPRIKRISNFVVTNDGSLDELQDKMRKIYDVVKVYPAAKINHRVSL